MLAQHTPGLNILEIFAFGVGLHSLMVSSYFFGTILYCHFKCLRLN